MQTLAAALSVMRDFDARDPRRKAKLDKLLTSGAVTQPAVNYAGLCDGGERGGGCLTPTPPQLHPLSYTPLAAAPQPRPSATAPWRHPSGQAPSERPFERRPNPPPHLQVVAVVVVVVVSARLRAASQQPLQPWPLTPRCRALQAAP